MTGLTDLLNGIDSHAKGIKCFIDMNKSGDSVRSLLEPHIIGLMAKIKELEIVRDMINIINNVISKMGAFQKNGGIFLALKGLHIPAQGNALGNY